MIQNTCGQKNLHIRFHFQIKQEFVIFQFLKCHRQLLSLNMSRNISQKLMLEGEWDELRAKTCLFTQSWTNYFEQGNKSKANWTKLEIINICFYILLDCYCQNAISGSSIKFRSLALGCLQPNLRIF